MATKLAGLAALVLVLAIAGCNFSMGADATGKKWIELIKKHHTALEEGKFDAEAFKKEARPIAEELKEKRDPDEKKVLLTDEVLAEFKKVSNEFETLLQEKGTLEQQVAYLEMVKIWTEDETPDANAPANSE